MKLSDKKIYEMLMKIKGELDTICEVKKLDGDHELVLASNHINTVLDNLESQKGK